MLWSMLMSQLDYGIASTTESLNVETLETLPIEMAVLQFSNEYHAVLPRNFWQSQ